MTKKPVKKSVKKTIKRKSVKKPNAGKKADMKLHYAEHKNAATRGVISRFFAWIFKTHIFKWALKIATILVLVPIVLTFLYKIEYVRPISTLMLERYLTFQEVKRDWVEIEDIAPVLVNSVIMSEDGKFCFHNGVDWDALGTVIDNALDGEKTRGASTLTMQSVKNLYLWNSRSYVRKGLEVPLALYANAVLSKRRMIEIYLNIAEWDEGVFGIEAAAKHYFKRSAKKLSSKQASLLTVTLPNPRGRNAAKPTKSMRHVAKIVAKRAQKSGAYVKCVKS